MANLIYSAITSLDGKVVDAQGNFDWAMPDEQVHAFVNDLERPVGCYLYGRRLYRGHVCLGNHAHRSGSACGGKGLCATLAAADKIVYSGTLAAPHTARTRIEKVFDIEAIRQLKATAATDLSIGGPTLAGHALRAGLVDECRFSSTRSSSAAAPPHCRTACSAPSNCCGYTVLTMAWCT